MASINDNVRDVSDVVCTAAGSGAVNVCFLGSELKVRTCRKCMAAAEDVSFLRLVSKKVRHASSGGVPPLLMKEYCRLLGALEEHRLVCHRQLHSLSWHRKYVAKECEL